MTQKDKERKWAEQLARIGAALLLPDKRRVVAELEDATAIMEELLKPNPDETLWSGGRSDHDDLVDELTGDPRMPRDR